MEVIRLLRSKNRCLKRVLQISNQFLAEAETGDLSQLPQFETRRAAVFKAIELYDRKINEVATHLPREQRTPLLIDGVSEQLQQNEMIIHHILGVDERIILHIDHEMKEVIKQSAQSRKSGELVGKFKSSWVSESGEGLDKKL